MMKREKFTQVYFNEADLMIEIDTHNTNLKHRLTAFAKRYPELCRITSQDDTGCVCFAIDKHRCAFRLTAPYSEERKQQLRESGKASGIHTREANHG